MFPSDSIFVTWRPSTRLLHVISRCRDTDLFSSAFRDSRIISPAHIDGRWERESSVSRLSFCEQIPLLGPDPIALCVGIETIVAAFDATRPMHTRFGIDILLAVQPATVYMALRGVYARLVDSVGVIRHSHERVIPVGCIVANAASRGGAMVRGMEAGICPGAAGFVLHDMVVAVAHLSQMGAQSICECYLH